MLGLAVQSYPTLCESVACQAPLFMGFSRQEYCSRLPCPPPGDLTNPEIKPRSPTLQANSLPAEPQGKPKNTGVGSLSPSPVYLSDPGIKPRSPALQADSLPTELSGLNWIWSIFTQTQMVSTIPYSLKFVSLKVMPTVGTMGRMHIPRTGEMVRRLA